MSYSKHCIAACAVCLIGISLPAAQSGPVSSQITTEPVHFPSPAKVDEAVAQYLESLTDRREDDLLSRGDVTPLFDVLEDIGWDVDPHTRKELAGRSLEDSDWLVRTLRTRKGTHFMRDMSSFPGGYDRLDRMRQQPQGKRELQGLIDSPGGAKLIEYLTTTKPGRNTGAQIPSGRGGAKFNTPTNRLYTKEDIAKQIRLSYAAEAERRLQATSVHTGRANPATAPPEPSPEPGDAAPNEPSLSVEE